MKSHVGKLKFVCVLLLASMCFVGCETNNASDTSGQNNESAQSSQTASSSANNSSDGSRTLSDEEAQSIFNKVIEKLNSTDNLSINFLDREYAENIPISVMTGSIDVVNKSQGDNATMALQLSSVNRDNERSTASGIRKAGFWYLTNGTYKFKVNKNYTTLEKMAQELLGKEMRLKNSSNFKATVNSDGYTILSFDISSQSNGKDEVTYTTAVVDNEYHILSMEGKKHVKSSSTGKMEFAGGMMMTYIYGKIEIPEIQESDYQEMSQEEIAKY